MAQDPNLQVVRHAANFIPYFGPVQTNPIMANQKVRQALAYALPYEEIHQKVYGGQGEQIAGRHEPCRTAFDHGNDHSPAR